MIAKPDLDMGRPPTGETLANFSHTFLNRNDFSKVLMLLAKVLFLSRLRDSAHVLHFHCNEFNLQNLSTRFQLLSMRLKQTLKLPNHQAALLPVALDKAREALHKHLHQSSKCVYQGHEHTKAQFKKGVQRASITKTLQSPRCFS